MRVCTVISRSTASTCKAIGQHDGGVIPVVETRGLDDGRRSRWKANKVCSAQNSGATETRLLAPRRGLLFDASALAFVLRAFAGTS